MSRLNNVLVEAEGKLKSITSPVSFEKRVVIADTPDDLLEHLKTLKSFPAIGVVYEGMRSVDATKPTENKGISNELVLSFLLIEQDDSIQRTDEKRVRATDCLDAMRDQFVDERSTVTGHLWKFLVESPIELKAGLVIWAQRWSLPIQMPKRRS